jgi:hypothetical protein
MLAAWALSPARPTPIHPRRERRGFPAFFGEPYGGIVLAVAECRDYSASGRGVRLKEPDRLSQGLIFQVFTSFSELPNYGASGRGLYK